MARKLKPRRSLIKVDFDKHVGQRIRERRVVLGLSQPALADGLGIIIQQLQNHEKGHNRIAARRIYGCAQLLGVRPEYYCEGLEHSDDRTPDEAKSDEALKVNLVGVVLTITSNQESGR